MRAWSTRTCQLWPSLLIATSGTVRTDVVDPETVRLEAVTTQSADHGGDGGANSVLASTVLRSLPAANELDLPDQIGQEFELSMDPGVPVTVEKVVAVATSRDRAISTPALAVAAYAARAGRLPRTAGRSRTRLGGPLAAVRRHRRGGRASSDGAEPAHIPRAPDRSVEPRHRRRAPRSRIVG